MIEYLQGTLVSKDQSVLILEVNGIGFHLNTSRQSFEFFEQGTFTKVYTYLHQPKEAPMELFGFHHQVERSVFLALLSVSGIGPKAAVKILSVATYDQLLSYIINKDSKALVKLPGIGAKSAEKVIFELSEKLQKNFSAVIQSSGLTEDESLIREALSQLGFALQQINAVLPMVRKLDLPVEEKIKKAMLEMGK